MAKIIDGKLVAKKILENLSDEILFLEKKPCLAVIIVGEDPASKIYVNMKKKKAIELGIESIVIELPEDISQNELLEKIDELNQKPQVNAILVQLPLPKHIDTNTVIEKINPQKDVDCFHPYNAGKIATNNKPYVYPCTPKGILRLMEYYDIHPEGKNVVVIGRSNIVGRPVALMLLNENATVTVCHSKTENLNEITKEADIIISAVGKADLIKKEMIKQGAVIIDVGMNRNEDGKLCGDVDFWSVEEKASFITPVPGGVGPMTICTLMQNTFELFKQQNNIN
ncbi:MAG: bifunctional methylenetetrahydrofolate dehydrogenase/methenyltetrahydrofolate cyclohydrolase FolD [Clostridium sp.]|nr:bifunctional methylenetetrahydrofolate dehydrogenase/methenyltetrahydrofolate cyclohydrolase FolD [Clostridium sp.]